MKQSPGWPAHQATARLRSNQDQPKPRPVAEIQEMIALFDAAVPVNLTDLPEWKMDEYAEIVAVIDALNWALGLASNHDLEEGYLG